MVKGLCGPIHRFTPVLPTSESRWPKPLMQSLLGQIIPSLSSVLGKGNYFALAHHFTMIFLPFWQR